VGGAGGTHGRGQKSVHGFGENDGKRPLRRMTHRWEDGIKMDFGAIGRGVCRVDSSGSG
jgi:hypothetical protein